MLNFLKRWATFVGERFDPVSRTLMVLTFFGANAYFADAVTGWTFDPVDAGLAFAVCLLFFFHLRLFDDWKDWDVDQQVNPERPLPRGLVEEGEYKWMMGAMIVLEVALAALIGFRAAVAVLLAVGYSLLMFVEFFVGEWLRPKLELYAVTHTLIAAWIALFVYVALTGVSVTDVEPAFVVVMGMAWMLFNIFEFARKTFAAEEEQEGVESYSRRLTPLGACGLVWACAALVLGGLALLVWWEYVPAVLLVVAGGMTAPAVVGSVVYLVHGTEFSGKVYRGVHSLYLIAFNAVFLIYGGMQWFG